jgi:hypothetical protein
VLLTLGGRAPVFLSELSRRQPNQLRREILSLYALYEQVGAASLVAAMAQAETAGSYSAATVSLLLATPAEPPPFPPLPVAGLPAQHEVDRALSVYEAWVQVAEAAVR